MTIAANNKYIKYQGRTWFSEDGNTAHIIWPASSISLSFQADNISFTLKDNSGRNVFNIYIDGKLHSRIIPDPENTRFAIKDLKKLWHTIKIIKCNEYNHGISSFEGFSFENQTELKLSEDAEIKFEFYGNSITTGRELEDEFGINGPKASNICNSYSFLVAEHFDAELAVIARSGIGLVEGFIPETIFDIYELVQPGSEEKWDPKDYKANIIVINLLQNDHSLIDRTLEAELSLESIYFVKYSEFLEIQRQKHPDAEIIALLGNMSISKPGSIWLELMEELIKNMEDPRIHFMKAEYKNTAGHPTGSEQVNLADELIQFIENELM